MCRSSHPIVCSWIMFPCQHPVFAPVIIFVAFATTAIGLQIFYRWAVNNKKPYQSLIGRVSALQTTSAMGSLKNTSIKRDPNGNTKGLHFADANIINHNGETPLHQVTESTFTNEQGQSNLSVGFHDCESNNENKRNILEYLDDFCDNANAQTTRKRAKALKTDDDDAVDIQSLWRWNAGATL